MPPLTLFCLHFLGGSAREFHQLEQRLAEIARVVAIDLPGFGAARDIGGYSVAEMADRVAGIVSEHAPNIWMLLGHSMGAKVGAVIARRAENGMPGLAGLVGLVVLAGSPPGPEPMQESKRNSMLEWVGDGAISRASAQTYIDDNIAAPLDGVSSAIALEDVQHAHPAAWRAWLTSGSREDLRADIGVLRTPALVVVGTEDRGLGEAAQRLHALPHYAHGRLVSIPHASHLLPFECADAIATLIMGMGAHYGPRL